MTKLSVVIPAFNEEKGIEDIVSRVRGIDIALKETGVDGLEILVVDDGSTDHTAEVASAVEGVQVLRHSENRGYGAALKTGFFRATGDMLGFLDADGTYPPEHFPQLCKPILDGAEMVIGSRMSGAQSSMPFVRRLGNRFFAELLTLVGRQRVSDSASGMRVFSRSVLERILPLPDGLNLTPVMSTRAIHEGVIMVEVPIPYSERIGPSKLSVFRDGSVFLQSIVWTVLMYNPARILGLLGMVGVGISIVVGLGIVYARLTGITHLGPIGVAAVFAALVAVVTGISLFALGTTFNYLVTLFYKRPVRQGVFGRPLLKVPLDRHFGWMGMASVLLGLGLSVASLAMGLRGWDIARLWLYLLVSAMTILVGLQLSTYWILVRVLDELSQREILVAKESTAVGPV